MKKDMRMHKHIKSCSCGKCKSGKIYSSAPHGENGPYVIYEESDDWKGYLDSYGELSNREDAEEYDMYDDAVAELDGIKDLLYSYDDGTEAEVIILDCNDDPVYTVKYTVVDGDVKETISNGCGKNKTKKKKSIKSTRKSIKSSVDWDDFDTPEANAINEKYLPEQGEGDTLATQAVTAVNKLIYQWYNNGEVYDNRGGFGSTVNECSSYANWLANHLDVEEILDDGANSDDESGYEDALKDLFDYVFDEALLAELNATPKNGSIYTEEGEFSTDHEICSECGENITDQSGNIDPEREFDEFTNKVWGNLARGDFDDAFEYHYGFYSPKDEYSELEDLLNDWYSEWYRNKSDNTLLCRYCSDDAADEAASFIEDNFDWEDEEGYDKRTGFNYDGYDREGYDAEGFNEGGVDREGYNREGFDTEGYNREGYNAKGVDREGLDRNGLRDGKMGSRKALKKFFGADIDEDLTHDFDYYRKKR